MSEKTVENAIKEKLTGDTQKNAMDFIVFLRANEFTLKEHEEHGHSWSVIYKGIFPVLIHFDVAGFELVIDLCTRDFYGDGILDNDLKEFIWAHTVNCPDGCDGTTICDRSQKNIKIFGKEYKNICITPLQILNPNANDFAQTKKLFLLLKQNIDDMRTE